MPTFAFLTASSDTASGGDNLSDYEIKKNICVNKARNKISSEMK